MLKFPSVWPAFGFNYNIGMVIVASNGLASSICFPGPPFYVPEHEIESLFGELTQLYLCCFIKPVADKLVFLLHWLSLWQMIRNLNRTFHPCTKCGGTYSWKINIILLQGYWCQETKLYFPRLCKGWLFKYALWWKSEPVLPVRLILSFWGPWLFFMLSLQEFRLDLGVLATLLS